MIQSPDGSGRTTLPGSLVRRVASLLGINQAIVYSLMTRGWQVLAVPVTFVLIAQRYSEEVQGFYYAFLSLLAMQSFFELGLFNVITNVTAHEWAHLSWTGSNRVQGDSAAHSRLRSLGRFALIWYGSIAVVFFLSISVLGHAILSQRDLAGIEWRLPWIAAVAFTSIELLCLPFNAMLEGCNRVRDVNLFRLVQASVAALVLWVTIWIGGGLWAPAAASAAKALCNLGFFAFRFGAFFRDFFARLEGPSISWRAELWPLQSRIAIQGAVGWFKYSLFVPVLFHYHGPVIAGQLGMTWQIVTGLHGAAHAWIQTRTPDMGILIARRRFDELDRLFRKNGSLTIGIFATGSAFVLLILVGLDRFLPEYSNRLLPASITAVFLLGMLLELMVTNVTVYVRAHKIEPFALMGIAASLSQGALVWLLGMRWASAGQAGSYLGITVFVVLPWALFILRRTRRDEQRHHLPGLPPSTFA